MPPKQQPLQGPGSSDAAETQQTQQSGTRQLITFVDSQDPNSRSAIQRHTAQHSNAQRRDARLQSLRSNRPRLLEWQRRPSRKLDNVSITSPGSSASSTSTSLAPGLRAPRSAPDDISTESSHEPELAPENTKGTTISTSIEPSIFETHAVSDDMIEKYLWQLCLKASRDTFRDLIQYIRSGDLCSNYLLLAYILACRGATSDGLQAEADMNNAQLLYGRGTRALRDRLTNPETASSDQNIQAVLLLIAYAADTGSAGEVSIHIAALSRMIKQRGGLRTLEAELDAMLLAQVQAISRSPHRHLTLECGAECNGELRFPVGSNLLELQDET